MQVAKPPDGKRGSLVTLDRRALDRLATMRRTGESSAKKAPRDLAEGLVAQVRPPARR
jgi:hypothetical protein